MQTEAAALKVPIRLLHQLRTQLPQPAEVEAIEADIWADSIDTNAVVLNAADPSQAGTSSEDEPLEADSALQTALLAAPQVLAATSGILPTYTQVLCTQPN